jgi:anti-anti-sigma factor
MEACLFRRSWSAFVSLQIETSRTERGLLLIKLYGNITRWGDRFIDDSLIDVLVKQGERELIVDLSGVAQMDSSGVQMLYEWFANLRQAGGELHLVGANARVARLFRVTRLDTVLKFYSSIAQASDAF